MYAQRRQKLVFVLNVNFAKDGHIVPTRSFSLLSSSEFITFDPCETTSYNAIAHGHIMTNNFAQNALMYVQNKPQLQSARWDSLLIKLHKNMI